MSTEHNIESIIENQRLILERMAGIESMLFAVFQIQGNFIRELKNEDKGSRKEILKNYSKHPDEMLEHFHKQSLDRFRPYQP
jgi:hypothetical protein